VVVLNFSWINGNFAGTATGVCTFSGGQHRCQMNLVRDSSGALKVDSFQWLN
jgi:hypothetical protein